LNLFNKSLDKKAFLEKIELFIYKK
jgi:hypothetical protein